MAIEVQSEAQLMTLDEIQTSFLIDSGSALHITNNKELLKNIEQISVKIKTQTKIQLLNQNVEVI